MQREVAPALCNAAQPTDGLPKAPLRQQTHLEDADEGGRPQPALSSAEWQLVRNSDAETACVKSSGAGRRAKPAGHR